MRKCAAQFKAKFPQFNDAFVVYDVFSDREPPKRGNGNGWVELESNEALFVTRSDTLPTVLGGLAARKRELQARVRRYLRISYCLRILELSYYKSEH